MLAAAFIGNICFQDTLIFISTTSSSYCRLERAVRASNLKTYGSAGVQHSAAG